MRSTAFQTCEKCDGLGFLRKGEFGIDRAYPRCPYCKGIGQRYLDPEPDKKLSLQGSPAGGLVFKTDVGGNDTPTPGL